MVSTENPLCQSLQWSDSLSRMPGDRKLWIITEASRVQTTVLTPDEY